MVDNWYQYHIATTHYENNLNEEIFPNTQTSAYYFHFYMKFNNF